MWCFHLGVQTPINPFHHCFTILGMTMMMVMMVMMVMVMRLEYKKNIHLLYSCSTILLMNTIDWFFFFDFGILYQDCDIGIYFYILFFLIIHSLQKSFQDRNGKNVHLSIIANMTAPSLS